MNVTVTVIMPVYNGAQYLGQAIESLLYQDWKNLEIIVVNDGSNDATAILLEKYHKLYPQLTYINLRSSHGQPYARNLGIKKAKGKYIAMLDADDIAYPNRIREQVEYLERNPQIFALTSGADVINEDGKIIQSIECKQCRSQGIKDLLIQRNELVHSSLMFRNEKVILYREKFVYSQDYDLYLQMLSAKLLIACLPKALVQYRINPNAVSFSKRLQQILFAQKARELYLQREITGHDTYSEFRPERILTARIENITSKEILSELMISSLKVGKKNETRKVIRQMHMSHVLSLRGIIYFLATFLPQSVLGWVRKLFYSTKRKTL